MEDEPKKKGKKVEVDEDFLKQVLKNQTDLKKELDSLKENPPQGAMPINIGSIALFFCNTTSTTPKEQWDKDMPNFSKELEILMRKYKMVRVEAGIHPAQV